MLRVNSNKLAIEKDFEAGLVRTFGPTTPSEPIPPLFGGRVNRSSLPLTAEGWKLVDLVLCVLAHDFPSLDYFPALPSLVALLTTIHGNAPGDVLGASAFLCRRYLGQDIRQEGNEHRYLPVNRRDLSALGRTFAKLLKDEIPAVHSHLWKRQSEQERSNPVALPREIEKVFAGWIAELLPVLPFQFRLRAIDSWLIEGDKVLLRFALATVDLFRSQMLGCETLDDLLKLLSRPQAVKALQDVTTEDLVKKAFSFSFSREDLPPLPTVALSHLSLTASASETGQHALRFIPKVSSPNTACNTSDDETTKSSILDDQRWIFLWSWIPATLNKTAVELVYKASVDGFRLATLYEKTQGLAPLILAVRTAKGQVFGAFIPIAFPFPIPLDSGRYIGTGETFVFTLEPMARCFGWVGIEAATSPRVDPAFAIQAIAEAQKAKADDNNDLGSSVSVLQNTSNPNLFTSLGNDETNTCPTALSPEEKMLLTGSTVSQPAPEPEKTVVLHGSEPIKETETKPPQTLPFRMRRASTTSDSASLFVLATQTELSIGGGGRYVALLLDQDLKGSTGECHTFHNVPLTGETANKLDLFEATEVEVFAFKH